MLRITRNHLFQYPISMAKDTRFSPKDQKNYRRQQLIEATIRTISEFGLSNTTISKVTKNANLSAGIVGFYFKSKEQLLLGTLEHLDAEYNSLIEDVFSSTYTPEDVITRFIEVSFGETLCNLDKISVWQAFSGESRARNEYMKICGDHDDAFYQALYQQIEQLSQHYPNTRPSPEAITRSLRALIDSYWLDYLFTPDAFDRNSACQICLDMLNAVFPRHFSSAKQSRLNQNPEHNPGHDDEHNDVLSPWTYTDPEFHELEKNTLFRKSWQLVGHVSELAQTPSYLSFDALGERAVVIKDHQGNIRAFHNVCRHRGAKLLDGNSGQCPHAISCPFHGWTYKLDGELIGVPAESTFPDLDRSNNALVSIDLEIWQGFIFIRFIQGEEGLAEKMSPVSSLLDPYQLESVELIAGTRYADRRPYNWKVIHDIDNEGYHVPMGHPALQQLYGMHYEDGMVEDIAVSKAYLNEKPGKIWSVRNYQNLLPHFDHLPEENQKLWLYIGISPNMVLGLYPDSIEFYMTLPISTKETVYRGAAYALPDPRKGMDAIRYLNRRINTSTEKEDESFVNWMQEGLRSSVFEQRNLSTLESGVKHFHQYIMQQIPVGRLKHHPGNGNVTTTNHDMLMQ
ncbi:MAG: Rieske 2Fe-2S domain-containing protein [Gammaproteobacteria bacterium]|nr:Rieske 2Fe-2S domain-containing protein [Gammaproteobacteria bacterium]